MARLQNNSTLVVGAVSIALAAAMGDGLDHLCAPLIGPLLAWSVGIALPALAGFAMMNRMQREVTRLDCIVDEAQALLGTVHGPGGDHILRLDRNGVIAADFSLGFGNPVKFEGPLVGMPLARLYDNDGFLAEAPAGGAERQRFAVRLCAQKSGTLAILRDVTLQRDLVQKLAHAATLDALTGLPNRQAFLHALERSCASGHAGFVAIFDIDQLNTINDRHGDATGDAVLRAFAADASELVRADDSLSRISGGSFAVILPTEDIARAEKIASRLIAKFGSAARAMGDAIVLATASAGIAPWRDNAAETIRDAESALRIAKARDYDRFEVAGAARRRA